MLTKFTGDLDIIAALDDEPNDVGGLTAAQLKAKFDQGAKTLADYINDTLTEELETVTLPAEGSGVLEKTAAGISWVPRTAPNILRNWYFKDPVNQRRAVSWNPGKYGPDCWKSNGGYPELAEGGLSLADKAQALQYIPLGRLVKGGTYTLSVKLAEDVEHVASGWSRKWSASVKCFTSAYASTVAATYSPLEAGVHSLTFTLPDTECLYYGVLLDAGKSYVTAPVVIESVKLERGDGSTLAFDGPPEPAAELLRCQTSFQLFADASRCPASRYDFRPVMDAEPTVSTLEIDGVTYTAASCEI